VTDGSGLGLTLALALSASWFALALAAVAAPRSVWFATRIVYPAGALVGLALALNGLLAIGEPSDSRILALGLPDLPFHVRLDSLAAFFHLLLGAVGAGVSIYAAGYFRTTSETATPGLTALQYHLFLGAMAFLFIADDAYLFMLAWETMALSSYFLVTTDHRVAAIRHAGYIYLLIAHIGALAIFLCFGALQPGGGDYTFDAMREMQHVEPRATAAFLLALAGFGAKAGIVPLHVWLPEAHPAAPSPVSALMSAVMLKTAVYGLLRVTFDLLDVQVWWWGVVALAIGLLTALYGVIFAAVQSDMKRLLAYSSIENVGIIVAGLGLTILFVAYASPVAAALTLSASLYHALNHAFFKSLLFLATGSVMHSTQQRSLGRLGGLIHRMPWVAWMALVGTLAIAGLPPLNGFVSEWLLLQAFLFTPGLPQSFVNMLIPVAAAALVLAAALAAYVMVKFYGVVFLGRPREPSLAAAHDAGIVERIALCWLALGCVVLGLLPVHVLGLLDHLNLPLVGGILGTEQQTGWLLVPMHADRASYSPLIVLLGIVAAVALTIWLVRRLYHGRVRRGAAWDCGFPAQTARMQDTAEGFGQPIRQIFEAFFRMERELPSPHDREPRYAVRVEDRFWYWLYLPIARYVDGLSRLASLIQQGRISVYLAYSFVTLIALLFFVQ
jgi:formate hydrogenlyase subunit 3/multisubunit Na+/H+ antiporter MnhD subunit